MGPSDQIFKPQHGDLTAKRVVRLSMGILASRAYAEGRPPHVPSLDWILHDLDPAPTMDSLFLQAYPEVRPVLRTNMHLAQIEAVRAGMGVALLTRALCRLFRDLVEIPFPDLDLPHIDLWLVTPPPPRQSPPHPSRLGLPRGSPHEPGIAAPSAHRTLERSESSAGDSPALKKPTEP